MTASKAKGTRAETAVVEYLKTHGFPYVERKPLKGNKDEGDIGGIPGVVLEVKNCARMDLAGWVDEAAQEALNARAEVFAVVHKRRGIGNPADWYVTLPLWVFAELIK